MVALKAAELDAFVARPRPAQPVVLVYGPDSGLVRERVDAIVRASVDDPRDPFALVHIEGDLLASEPSRLVEEAHTVPLFGGRRAVLVKSGNRNFLPAVEAVLATPPTDCRIVIEAGDLRRSAPLRLLCERSKVAVALPCYPDGERELARLVDDETRAAKLDVAPDARAALVTLLGGDRLASRSELRKLALYAHGKQRIELDDVFAVVADASALTLDAVIDSAFAGRTGETETQFGKALAGGTAAGTVMSAALRHVMLLHRARLAMEAGERTDAALGVFVPPLHFRRRPLVETALAGWSAARLARAMEQLAEAVLLIRRTPELAESLSGRALLAIAVSARRRSA